jgi:hypothetical protein
MAEQLTAQQRAQLFAMSTRQNYQMLAKETASQGATTVQFSLPKARLLSKVMVNVDATVKVKHDSKTSIEVGALTPYKVIRRIALDLNNGFSPYVVAGEECAMYNSIDKNGDKVYEQSNYRNVVSGGTFTASAEGSENKVNFMLELPVAINPRDPIGLILLQNDQTNVTLTVDIANGIDMFNDVDTTGYTVDLSNITVTPCLETFSIPANANAYPDLSVIKLVNGRSDALASTGQQVIKLSTGTIYRKLMFYVVDENGVPMDAADITSDIQLVFNQADINYSVSPDMLRAINTHELGFELPNGMYVFDFSAGGNITNYGGTRDYIDTEKLTEFWLRFNTNKRGKVVIVSECLARLQ